MQKWQFDTLLVGQANQCFPVKCNDAGGVADVDRHTLILKLKEHAPELVNGRWIGEFRLLAMSVCITVAFFRRGCCAMKDLINGRGILAHFLADDFQLIVVERSQFLTWFSLDALNQLICLVLKPEQLVQLQRFWRVFLAQCFGPVLNEWALCLL